MIVVQRYSFNKHNVSVVFPQDYDVKTFINFIYTRKQQLYTITSIGNGDWIRNNKQLVDKYNLTKVLAPSVNLEDVMEYCKIFDEEVIYAKDYHSK
jgi:hypothetical protein